MNQNHKYLLIGVLVGVLALWVWNRRSGAGGMGGTIEGG